MKIRSAWLVFVVAACGSEDSTQKVADPPLPPPKPTLTVNLKAMNVRGGMLEVTATYEQGTKPYNAKYDVEVNLPAAGCTIRVDNVGSRALYASSGTKVDGYTVSVRTEGCAAGSYGTLPYTAKLIMHGTATVLAVASGEFTGPAAVISDPFGPKPDLAKLRTELAALAPIAKAGVSLGPCKAPLSGPLGGVDLDHLLAWGGDRAAVRRTQGTEWERSSAFLNLGAFFERGEHERSAEDEARFLDPLMLVYVAKNRRLPYVRDDGFDGGVFEGTAVVVDRSARKALCSAPLVAHSSERVSYTQESDGTRVWWNDAQRKIEADFVANFVAGMEAAVKQLSPGLVRPDQPIAH